MKNILKKYGITIKREKLLRTALTHSSYSNEHGGECYERLEYLGDAVLEIVCSDYLYNKTDYSEGQMSNLRRHYVCEAALDVYASEINLKDYILLGNGISEANKTIIADVFDNVDAIPEAITNQCYVSHKLLSFSTRLFIFYNKSFLFLNCISIGVPSKSKFSLILFSKYLSYEKCTKPLLFTWNTNFGGLVSV